MDASEIAARVEISAILHRYVMGVDHGDYDAIGTCFAEDGVFHFLPPVQGRGAILKKLGKGRFKPGEGGLYQRHHLTSSRVDFQSPTEATGHSYVAVYTELGLDHWAFYKDEYRKIGNDWFIQVRRGGIDWMRPDSRFARSARPKVES